MRTWLIFKTEIGSRTDHKLTCLMFGTRLSTSEQTHSFGGEPVQNRTGCLGRTLVRPPNLETRFESRINRDQHCTAGSSRSFTALRKEAGLCCGSRLLEGRSVCLCWAPSKPKGPKGCRLQGHVSMAGLNWYRGREVCNKWLSHYYSEMCGPSD